MRTGSYAALVGCALLGTFLLTAWIQAPPSPSSSLEPALQPNEQRFDADGEKIYVTRCMSCHQMDGTGISGVFPPLIGSEWVEGDKGRLIRLVLHGMMGEIEVNGVKYSGAMPPWKSFLNDEEMAAVLTYIRSAWSNEGAPVTAQEVAAVRAATADRNDSWTVEELSQKANQGIPGNDLLDLFGPPADSTADSSNR